MSEVEKRKENIKWLLEGELGYKVFNHHNALKTEIYDRDNAMRLFEECLTDIYQQIEKFDVKVVDKLKQKIKTLEARITVLESHQKDDGSTIVR